LLHLPNLHEILERLVANAKVFLLFSDLNARKIDCSPLTP